MLGIERRRKIMDKLNEERKVYVSELAKLFGVTEETIRRDLEKLEGKDLLRRSYGGAVLNEHTNDDISFVKRSTILSENKQAIAERALAAKLAPKRSRKALSRGFFHVERTTSAATRSPPCST